MLTVCAVIQPKPIIIPLPDGSEIGALESDSQPKAIRAAVLRKSPYFKLVHLARARILGDVNVLASTVDSEWATVDLHKSHPVAGNPSLGCRNCRGGPPHPALNVTGGSSVTPLGLLVIVRVSPWSPKTVQPILSAAPPQTTAALSPRPPIRVMISLFCLVISIIFPSSISSFSSTFLPQGLSSPFAPLLHKSTLENRSLKL